MKQNIDDILSKNINKIGYEEPTVNFTNNVMKGISNLPIAAKAKEPMLAFSVKLVASLIGGFTFLSLLAIILAIFFNSDLIERNQSSIITEFFSYPYISFGLLTILFFLFIDSYIARKKSLIGNSK